MKKLITSLFVVISMLGSITTAFANNTSCPFDGGAGMWTGKYEVVDAKMYNIYRCGRGHEYLVGDFVSNPQSTPPSPAFEAGQAIGQGLGALLAGKANSIHSDHQDNINKNFDFSTIKNILVFSFSDQNPNNIYDEDSCIAAGHWFKQILAERITENCPNVLIFGPDVDAVIKQEYAKYIAVGGNLSEKDFGAELLRNFADLMITFKTELNGRNSERAWCNMTISAVNAKTGENAFTRSEQRVHINHSSKIYTEKDCTLKTVSDYTKKLAKMIKKSQDDVDDTDDE